MDSQARSDYPIAIRLSVKSQFVPDRLDDSQARSDYPIAIRLSVKSQFVPDRLDGFPSQAKTARQSESRIARYEQKSREGEVGSREEKGRKSDEMRAKGRAASFKVGPRAPSSRAARDDHAPVSTSAPNGPFEPPIASPHLVRSFSTFGISIWTLGGTGTQTETNCAATVREHGNRENPSGQKSSHLFFVRCSLCQGTPNKEGATVITPFLPTGFSRVSARMAGRPGPSPYDPTKPAYLGGNVCAEILSGPLQFGPRAKTLRQEVHFSYHMQLSDHQELLRSSRNLSQKMTPWHKERSNGLRSQDHILRTQARLCARPSLPDSQQVDPQARVRWKEDTLMHDVELSDRQDLSGRVRNPDRKTALKRTKNTPVASGRGTISHKSKLGFPRNPEPCKKFEEKRAGRKTHFSSRTAAFARRVFPARNKLIYEPGCVGKITTPATSWNSRFAESIPHLIGIFTGKVHENSSNAPTSGSHNSLIRTPIHANFVPLERGRRELSGDMLHDPF
uniref:Uncharacterized protein n=1 Tax=Fagus sylvatica TaxID=28930 RepID=A0A2N9EHF9_FAGSY